MKTQIQYSEANARKWLSWLAFQMQLHGHSIFQVEQIQPTWLYLTKHINAYRLIISTLAGIFGGLICGLVYWQVDDINVGILDGLAIGLIGGYGSVAIHFARFQGRRFLNRLYEMPAFVLIMSLIFLFFLLFSIPVGLIYGFGNGLLVGLVNSVFFGVFLGLRGRNRRVEHDIQPIEQLRWSWNKAQKSGLMGLLIGFVSGIALDFIVIELDNLDFSLVDIAIFALTGGITGLLFGGTVGAVVDMRTIPNQGMHSSLRNALVMSCAGFASGFSFAAMQTFGLMAGLDILLIENMQDGLLAMATIPLAFAFIAFFWFGGQDVIQHVVLRTLLYRYDKTPIDYVHFLDYAANELNFLQKVGGGYMFVHRYLLEHFASMAEETREIEKIVEELGVLS